MMKWQFVILQNICMHMSSKVNLNCYGTYSGVIGEGIVVIGFRSIFINSLMSKKLSTSADELKKNFGVKS